VASPFGSAARVFALTAVLPDSRELPPDEIQQPGPLGLRAAGRHDVVHPRLRPTTSAGSRRGVRAVTVAKGAHRSDFRIPTEAGGPSGVVGCQ
jgi:hypothetical protein